MSKQIKIFFTISLFILFFFTLLLKPLRAEEDVSLSSQLLEQKTEIEINGKKKSFRYIFLEGPALSAPQDVLAPEVTLKLCFSNSKVDTLASCEIKKNMVSVELNLFNRYISWFYISLAERRQESTDQNGVLSISWKDLKQDHLLLEATQEDPQEKQTHSYIFHLDLKVPGLKKAIEGLESEQQKINSKNLMNNITMLHSHLSYRDCISNKDYSWTDECLGVLAYLKDFERETAFCSDTFHGTGQTHLLLMENYENALLKIKQNLKEKEVWQADNSSFLRGKISLKSFLVNKGAKQEKMRLYFCESAQNPNIVLPFFSTQSLIVGQKLQRNIDNLRKETFQFFKLANITEAYSKTFLEDLPPNFNNFFKGSRHLYWYGMHDVNEDGKKDFWFTLHEKVDEKKNKIGIGLCVSQAQGKCKVITQELDILKEGIKEAVFAGKVKFNFLEKNKFNLEFDSSQYQKTFLLELKGDQLLLK